MFVHHYLLLMVLHLTDTNVPKGISETNGTFASTLLLKIHTVQIWIWSAPNRGGSGLR